jgi:hypothetical protein
LADFTTTTPELKFSVHTAVALLQEAGAIRECEEHGWMQDRTDRPAANRKVNAITATQALPKSEPITVS